MITQADIARAFPDVSDIGTPQAYGQKTVVSCSFEGQALALKILLEPERQPGEGGDPEGDPFDETAARTRREVETLQECDCPHLVDLGPIPPGEVEIGGTRAIYFTEEWIEGGDLKEILLDVNRLSVADGVTLAKHVTAAIAELWSHNKVHRDIKPGNIMRRSDGDYVLLDMGIAFDVEGTALTVTAGLLGTWPYFSPEQMDLTRKRELDFRSDLYSLGLVLYEALTGKHPYWTPGMGFNQIVEAILHATVQPPSQLNSEIQPDLEKIMVRMLAKRPHRRFASCEQLISELDLLEV